MDAGTGDVRAVEFTSSRQGDSPLLPDLLAQIPPEEAIGTVTADGAYDTRRCHGAIIDRAADAVIPIRRNGRVWKEDCPAAAARNEILRATRRLGRTFWKKWTGYHVRSRVEAKMNCLKLFGERIVSRDPDRQTAGIQTHIAIMNRFSALGRAEIRAVC
ncbi:DDE family transposase [Limimaricola soesokkakensis]|uniref:DDE family transposase n=1 Tax=Limimaricola soesokkakensis TaxID=1343159 RepID=A0A1X7A4D0_9RHOB|nr:DDE family transposase [Limimaricola soesokkakensis]SLN69752.1 Transposase DDE domain protein [Limimaricola soesokkakensis]